MQRPEMMFDHIEQLGTIQKNTATSPLIEFREKVAVYVNISFYCLATPILLRKLLALINFGPLLGFA